MARAMARKKGSGMEGHRTMWVPGLGMVEKEEKQIMEKVVSHTTQCITHGCMVAAEVMVKALVGLEGGRSSGLLARDFK